jgi:hypothetical protein
MTAGVPPPREEEEALNVPLPEDGILIDPDFPVEPPLLEEEEPDDFPELDPLPPELP